MRDIEIMPRQMETLWRVLAGTDMALIWRVLQEIDADEGPQFGVGLSPDSRPYADFDDGTNLGFYDLDHQCQDCSTLSISVREFVKKQGYRAAVTALAYDSFEAFGDFYDRQAQRAFCRVITASTATAHILSQHQILADAEHECSALAKCRQFFAEVAPGLQKWIGGRIAVHVRHADGRPTTGDRVTIIAGGNKVGQTGVICEDDHDTEPYLVRFSDGEDRGHWFRECDVRREGE